MRYLDALLEIEELTALQWTPGINQPHAGHEKWYFVHDKARKAGKSLWIYLDCETIRECVDSADIRKKVTNFRVKVII